MTHPPVSQFLLYNNLIVSFSHFVGQFNTVFKGSWAFDPKLSFPKTNNPVNKLFKKTSVRDCARTASGNKEDRRRVLKGRNY